MRIKIQGVGEFTSIETSPTETNISFKDRKTAEKFFNEVTLNGGEIPGLKNGGQVELAWSGGGATVVSSSAVSSAAATPGSMTGMNMNTTTDDTMKTTAGAGAGKNGLVGAATTAHIMETDDRHSGSDDKDVNIILDYEHHHHQTVNNPPQQTNDTMDYDVADENQWD